MKGFLILKWALRPAVVRNCSQNILFHNIMPWKPFLPSNRLGKQIGPHLFITEIRTIAADNLWMSPCRNQDSVTIHFTWKQEWDSVSKLLPQIEKELAPFNPRPHWGKLFTMPAPVLESRYEKLAILKNWSAHYDPKGKFRNDFLNGILLSMGSMRIWVMGYGLIMTLPAFHSSISHNPYLLLHQLYTRFSKLDFMLFI